VAVFETPPEVPVIVAVVFVVTFVVLTENVAEVLPAAITTELGGVTELKLLLKVTDRPPAGAMLLILTVPVAEAPPFTVTGATVRERRRGALIVSAAVWDEAPLEAVIPTIV